MGMRLLLGLLGLPAGVEGAFLRSFGSTPDQLQPGKRGTGVQHICIGATPVVFLNHTLSAGATLGVVDQFWTVGADEVGLAKQGLRLEVSYWFDGEAQPSVVFEPAFANGNGWAAVFQNGQWRNGQQQAGDLGLFSAGPQMGKSATMGGWWNKHKLPFQQSVVVTAAVVPRSPDSFGSSALDGAPVCTSADFIVRGYESTAAGAAVTLSSGLTLPQAARMGLARIEPAERVAAYQLAELAIIPKGREGVLYLVNLALEASPPWGINTAGGRYATRNNYVEGCWHFRRTVTEPLPAMVVGTGLEDFFDSAFGFSIIGPNASDPTASGFSNDIQRTCKGVTNPHGPIGARVCEVEGVLFQHETSGILHFSSDSTAKATASPGLNQSALGVERLSAYRFLHHEVLAFEDGGALLWRNSDHEPKCRASPTEGVPKPDSHATMVRSYVWYYHWPKGSLP